MKRTTTSLPKSSESGDDSSYSTRRPSASRRHRSLSRFSHRMPDPEIEVTPMRKGKFVNTVRGSGFGEISLDDLAVEFFESFSGESEISSGERGRSGLRKSGGGGGGEVSNSQRRGRSVSRVVGSGGGLRRLDADTESSRRRRSLSRQPASNRGGSGRVDPVSSNSSRGRSVSRQPRERKVNGDNGGSSIGGVSDNANSRRRRSLSVVRRRIENSESDVDQAQYSSSSRDVKSYMGGKSQNSGSQKSASSDNRQSLRRSCSQNPIKYHDGYSSHSSAVTDDEGKDSRSSKHETERIIRTVYAQNKATPKKRSSLGNSDYGSQEKPHEDHRTTSTFKKGYATKLQESEERKRDLLAEIMLEEQRGRELSMNLNELLTENSSEAEEKPLRTRKRSKDRSRRTSMCLTDEAEQFIDEFISNIEDTDFSSLEDERSESSSSFGMIKSQSSQSTTVLKSVPVEMDGVMLPWLQWEAPDDTSAALACLNKSPHTPNTKTLVWESDPTQDASSGQGTSIGTISSRGSWSPCYSSTKPVTPIRRLKIDVAEYLKRPNSSDILNETWKLRHRISSGSLVLCSRSLI
ncbi:PREDICTED: uncharacterized protein LOC104761027 isoform X1 [Camelina sativa]|uniref:Uncharacterized protein LOC104761027 isoform X1 n=1 Tax=Camelina sativa TaxID=90675 RepID=A0ABM1R8T3_CAMSA|nr:PREDICTED: uncharacterized protein LOC104761027 isoform X2 [Camelina sativa]XP_019095421.1 PREDICTED: uncharacterized protein LOC104761027 isoform X1 [Camelina sativa]